MRGEAWTDEQLAQALEMQAAGATCAEIGAELKRTRRSVAGKLSPTKRTPEERRRSYRAAMARHELKSHEIEPGRGVMNDWDRELFEPWAQRKARLARERSAGERSGGAHG